MFKSIETSDYQTSSYRWLILGMTALTGFIVMGFHTTSISVLFSEISQDLDLDLVQIGLVWGIGSLMGIFTALIGGSVIDYFGTRRSLVVMCILIGIFGAMRALATDFWTLFLFSFLFGIFQPILPINLIKLMRQWFSQRQLGLASGIMSAGFATGLLLGSRLSATVLSPALGGWRAVLLAIGLLAIVIGFLWYIIHPSIKRDPNATINMASIWASFREVSQYRALWLLSLIGFGIGGLMRGVVGYVPTYLREIGWQPVDADTAISAFFFASLIGVVPLSWLSDRIGNRVYVLILATILMTIGTLMMFFVNDYNGVIFAMLLAGFAFDAFMATHNATATEVEGLSIAMMGSAIGLIVMIRNMGSVLGPVMGNTLSTLGLNVPFLVWAGYGVLACVTMIVFSRNKTYVQKRKKVAD